IEHMASGEMWVFDTWRRHSVINPAGVPRVHLVVDTVGSRSLWQLVEHPEEETRVVIADGSGSPFPTEIVNYPTVMSPWEVDRNLDEILSDLAPVAPSRSDALRRRLSPWRHAWRATWARYGDTPSGRPAFVSLCVEADELVESVAD